MAVFKCKMCGGDLDVTDVSGIAECEYCGCKQTTPKAIDEELQQLFNRANTLRIKSEFDKAEKIYEKIIQMDGAQADAYWGLILCKYGIEYVEDPASSKRVPTCHRASYDSIVADEDYKSALENADGAQRALYEEQAKEIDRIQKDILAISQNEEKYDVFICYKETGADGKRTQDSVIANDIYYQLTQEGFKVFYAAITLEGKLGSAYEPIIFAALNSAKVMLCIGTKPEYFSAVWVKNEWSRYLKIVSKDRSKLLIPCYRDMDAYELPEEFAHLQAQDMSKIGFINDIVRGIKKVVKKDEPKPTTVVNEPVATTNAATNIEALLKRAFIFLEDRRWTEADEYCEKVLDQDPENVQAYLGKLMVECKARQKAALKNCKKSFENSYNYERILRYANENLKAELTGYLAQIKERESVEQEAKKKKKKKNKIIALVSSLAVVFLALLGYFGIYPLVSYWAGDYTVYINMYSVEEFEVPEGVTSIEDYEFCYCSSLTSITIPDSVTSIGKYAFYGCSSLTSITIPDSVTSIGDFAFSGCSPLTSITIPDSVTSIGYSVFKDCSSLTSITLPFTSRNSTTTESISLSYIFEDVPDSLKTVVITGGTNIGSKAFYSCRSLTSITIPSSVTRIGDWAFFNCSSLTSITIPDSVKSIWERAFSGCSKLTSITIPDSVKSIGEWAFFNCSSLTSITIPSSVTSIGDNAFNSCSSLTTVTIADGVTSIGDLAFFDCSSLTSVTIPSSVTSIGDSAFYGCSKLTSITIPSSVTSIGGYAFSGCNSLTSITIPDGVTSIGYFAFQDCSSLTSITIPSSVTSIGDRAFYNCSSLTSVTFVQTSGWKYDSYTTISASDLADPATAAKYLTSTYYYYGWTRG